MEKTQSKELTIKEKIAILKNRKEKALRASQQIKNHRIVVPQNKRKLMEFDENINKEPFVIKTIIDYYEKLFNAIIEQIPEKRERYIANPEEYGKKQETYHDYSCPEAKNGYVQIEGSTSKDTLCSREQMRKVLEIVKKEIIGCDELPFCTIYEEQDSKTTNLRRKTVKNTNTTLGHIMALMCRRYVEYINYLIENDTDENYKYLDKYKNQFLVFHHLAQYFNNIYQPFELCRKEIPDTSQLSSDKNRCIDGNCIYNIYYRGICAKPKTYVTIRKVPNN